MKCEYCGSSNSADQYCRCIFCGAQMKQQRIVYGKRYLDRVMYSGGPACTAVAYVQTWDERKQAAKDYVSEE